jgi:uncharacterized membrane protein
MTKLPVNRYLILFLTCFWVWFFVFPAQALPMPQQPKYEKARVMEVETFKVPTMGEPKIEEISQQVTVKILSGKFKGETVVIDHAASGMMGGDMILRTGDRVMLYVDESPSSAESPGGTPIFNIADYARDFPLFWLIFFYALLLAAIGGSKGLKSLLSLFLSLALIIVVLFPLTLWGFNPLLVSIVVAGGISLMSFRIIGGKDKKNLGAAIGTLLGVVVAGIMAYVIGNMVHVVGMDTGESDIALFPMNFKVDYQGLLFGSILLGALGAIMNVGLSIASAVDEAHKIHPRGDFRVLFEAGMAKGKDEIGTISNILILAYTGSALPLLFLLVVNKISFSRIMNIEMVAVEVVRALAGSIGLVLSVPMTAAVSAFLNSKRNPLKKS